MLKCRYMSILQVLTLTLAPLIVSAAEREPDNRSNSPVADAGQKPLSIEIKAVTAEGEGKTLGVVRARQLATGVLFEPALEGLTPGLHGFHIHENDSCRATSEEESGTANSSAKPAGEAGKHWDPGAKGNHAGPWGQGHLGDLPNLQVDKDSTATLPVYAPRLTLRDLGRRALVIHAEADNYTDDPDAKGGSGKAVACGVADPEE